MQTGSPLTQSWYYNTAQAPAHGIGFAQPVRPAQPHILQQPYPSTPPIHNNANINLKKTPFQHLVTIEVIGLSLKLYGSN